MNNSRSIVPLIAVSAAVAILWVAFGSGNFSQPAGAVEPADNEQLEVQLERAATALTAAAKQSVQAASTDEEAANRVQVSIEALRLIGMLGKMDTDAQTERLLDELQEGARPAVGQAVVQTRIARQLQQWNQLDENQRSKAIDRFVNDVKDVGLTPGFADLFMRLVGMLEGARQSELAAQAIGELLPAFQESADPRVQRRAASLEGVIRRLPGQPMELEGTLLDGSEFDWDSFRGKVVLVDFFASWCGPCRAEVPNILANYNAYRDKGFVVVGVNMDKDRAAAESYISQAGFDFPTLFSDDPSATGWEHPMARKYGVNAIPRVILVDREGVIVDTAARGPRLAALLEEMLGPPSAPADDSAGDAERES